MTKEKFGIAVCVILLASYCACMMFVSQKAEEALMAGFKRMQEKRAQRIQVINPIR